MTYRQALWLILGLHIGSGVIHWMFGDAIGVQIRLVVCMIVGTLLIVDFRKHA